MTTAAADLSRRFAETLDRREYDELRSLLATDCVYEILDRRITGSEAIIAAYRSNTEWAFDVFDEIEFCSVVIAESECSARITFTDRLHFGSAVHEFTCQQMVHVDRHDRIDHIKHFELAGQTAALEAFFEKCGIARPPQT
jgi:hypothetical protein